MDVHFHYQNASKFLEIAEAHGKLVTNLTISGPKFKNVEEFSIFLLHFPLVENLTVDGIEFVEEDSKIIEPITMKNLKEVSLKFSTDFNYLKSFIAPRLKSFNSTFLHSSPLPVSSDDHLSAFLQAAPELKSLEIDHLIFELIFSNKISRNFPFRLTKFSSLTHHGMTDSVQNNLENFLDQQSSSLADFEWKYLPQSLLSLILTKMKNLKRLKLNRAYFPNHKSFYENLLPIESMSVLEVDEIPREAYGVLGKFPYLKLLKIKANSNILRFISITNPKLNSLMIDEFDFKVSSKAKFEFLTFFSVENCKKLPELLDFLKNNTKVESLVLRYFFKDQPVEYVFDTLLSMKNLTRIKVCGEIEKINKISDKIKSSRKPPEVNEVQIKNIDGGLKYCLQFWRRL